MILLFSMQLHWLSGEKKIYADQHTGQCWWADHGANRKSLLKGAKAQVTECDSERRLEHARGLQHQGQLLHATDDKTVNIRSSAVLQLPLEVLSFSMNAALDTSSATIG